MVTGHGLIAGSFRKYEALNDFLIFASGVSNSKSCTAGDCQRERELLLTNIDAHPAKTLVYFSTSSVNDPDLAGTPYVIHKLAMEAEIRQHAKRYHIFRLSNVAGFSRNPNTILNFFYNCIVDGRPFELWKFSERNVIDVEDVFHVSHHILQKQLFLNGTINIANPVNYPVSRIIRSIEDYSGKSAVFTEKEKGSGFTINIDPIRPIFDELRISFDDTYLPRLLSKYYPRT